MGAEENAALDLEGVYALYMKSVMAIYLSSSYALSRPLRYRTLALIGHSFANEQDFLQCLFSVEALLKMND